MRTARRVPGGSRGAVDILLDTGRLLVFRRTSGTDRRAVSGLHQHTTATTTVQEALDQLALVSEAGII